jgi:endonuclease/exonuclease/phosphatase family metal-dependent hydrolase
MSWSLWLALLACVRTPPMTDTSFGSVGDDDDDDDDDEPIRVVTWNVESLGTEGSEQFEAVQTVLARLDADIVSLNEVNEGESEELEALADALDYDTVIEDDKNPFGGLHNAILTRLEVVDSEVWTADALSGDGDANDLTRLPVSVVVETPSGRLAVVGEHWKSGFELIDEFRRVVESIRMVQVAQEQDADSVLVLGDVNAELDDDPPSVETWEYMPEGEPFGFELGEDLQDQLDSDGIPNDVFLPLDEGGLQVVDALQLDGRDGTREESGRRIDHIFASDSVEIVASEVYDARDESMGGVPKAGDAPDRYATLDASDHFPVLVDVIP